MSRTKLWEDHLAKVCNQVKPALRTFNDWIDTGVRLGMLTLAGKQTRSRSHSRSFTCHRFPLYPGPNLWPQPEVSSQGCAVSRTGGSGQLAPRP